jgi:hypothetical protein
MKGPASGGWMPQEFRLGAIRENLNNVARTRVIIALAKEVKLLMMVSI